MSRRGWWGVTFLGLTALVVGLEVWASFDGSPDTVPWTDYITTHIPGEIAAVAIGGLSLWLVVHFGIRYWRAARQDKKEEPHGEDKPNA